MRSRLATLVILALLAFFLYRFAVQEDINAVPPVAGGVVFPGLEIQDIDFVSMRFRTLEILDIRREPQGPWMITLPTDEVAQREFVESLVRNLAEAKFLPVGEQGEDIDPEAVGLGRRAKSITFGRGHAQATILIGDRNPVGPGVFAQILGTPHVVLVTENLDNKLEQFRAQDYVDKHMLRGLEGSVRSVRIEFPDRVLLDARLDGDHWSLTEPVAARADNNRISTLVRSLRFIEQSHPIDIDVTDSELRSLGLPTADQVEAGDWAESTMIQLGAAGVDPARIFLMKGWNEQPDADILAVRNDLRKILVIDRRELNLLLNGPDFFRERRVVPPIRDRARRVRIDVGDDVQLDIRQDDQGRWTYTAPEHLRGITLDSERIDGFSLVSEFLGDIDQLQAVGFDDAMLADEESAEPLATIRVDWNWARSDRSDRLSLYDLDGDLIRTRASDRPTEGLLLGPEVLELLDPALPERLRNLSPIDVPDAQWGALDIILPGADEALSVQRAGPGVPWTGDDEWGRRYGLGHDLLRGFRGLRWQAATALDDAAGYPWRIVFRGFDGAELGTLSLREVRPGEPTEMLGQPTAVARWSGVPGMEMFVNAQLLQRVAALSSPQGRED